MRGCTLLTLSSGSHFVDPGRSSKNRLAPRLSICYHVGLMTSPSWPFRFSSRVDSASAQGRSARIRRPGGSSGFQAPARSRFNMHRGLSAESGRPVASRPGVRLHSHIRGHGLIGIDDLASVETPRLMRAVSFNMRVSEIRPRPLASVS